MHVSICTHNTTEVIMIVVVVVVVIVSNSNSKINQRLPEDLSRLRGGVQGRGCCSSLQLRSTVSGLWGPAIKVQPCCLKVGIGRKGYRTSTP